MSKSIRIPSLAKIAAKLESMMDVARPFRDADDVRDVRLALGSLLLSCHDCLDSLAAIGGKASLEDVADAATAVRMDSLMRELAGSLPPVRGGGPDDHEEVSAEFLADPEGWPAEYTPELDGYIWEPTPDHILAAERDAHTDCVDWDAYSLLDVAGISEADHLIAHGCC